MFGFQTVSTSSKLVITIRWKPLTVSTSSKLVLTIRWKPLTVSTSSKLVLKSLILPQISFLPVVQSSPSLPQKPDSPNGFKNDTL